jgi:hypothetical protein
MTAICNRCLVQSPGALLLCRWISNDGLTFSETMQYNPTSPVEVDKWIREKLSNPDAKEDTVRFDINGFHNAVRAISTWQGDPVCSPHLYNLIQPR